jgi:flavodoxin
MKALIISYSQTGNTREIALVPKEAVGRDGLFFQAHPKHPRFRIPKDE